MIPRRFYISRIPLTLCSALLLTTLVMAEPSSSSPTTRTTLEAWQQAKYGLFIHWGLYSRAGGQWKGSWVATEGPWKGKGFTEFLQLQGQIPIKEYEEFARGFRPEAFDAHRWAQIARDAGMRYLVFTAKHHEGFAMYRSASSPFNIVDHSGFGRDPVAELAAACRRHGLMFGVYYSLGRDWHDPDAPTNWPTKGGRSNTWDYPNEDAKDFASYFRRKVLSQIRELMSNYGPISILWFDTPEGISAEQSQELRDLVRTLQPACLVNDRVGNKKGDFETLEQKVSGEIIREPWEACATLGKNWGFHERDRAWKSPEQIVRLLTDVVAKNGNLLFNVGPKGDGTFPEGSAEHLKQVGDWLAVNGAAIYGAKAWTLFGESPAPETAAAKSSESTAGGTHADTLRDEISRSTAPDLRFTLGSDGALYLLARSWQEPTVVSSTLGSGRAGARRVKGVTLLGSPETIRWEQSPERLQITFPARRPVGVPVWVFRILLD